MMTAAIQPIHIMVTQAASGTELELTLASAPLEDLSHDEMHDFFERGGAVYHALTKTDPARAVAFRQLQTALTLADAKVTGDRKAILQLRERLSQVFGGLNGAWTDFRRVFDQRSSLFAQRDALRAQANRTLSGTAWLRTGLQQGNFLAGEIDNVSQKQVPSPICWSSRGRSLFDEDPNENALKNIQAVIIADLNQR